MKTIALLALLTAAPQGDAPVKPEKPLDPKDPRSLAEHAAYNTRTQQSYRSGFTARIAFPGGDPIEYRGSSLWVAPSLLYIHYTASGGDLKNILRAGVDKKGVPNVWIHHEAAGWVTPADLGMPGAARGIQNPDEVLAVLARHLDKAKLLEPGVVEVSFGGNDIGNIMKDQAQKGAFVWKESSATVRLHVDLQTTRLEKFTCEASLQSANPQAPGVVRYTAEVKVEAFNRETEMKFTDEKKQAIPLDKEILEAVENAKKERR